MHKSELKNTNVAVKAGFTSMLLLVLVFGIFSLYQLRNVTFSMTDEIAINSKKIVHVVLMRDAIRQRQVVMTEMLATRDEFEREESRLLFFNLARVFREERDKLLAYPVTAEENTLLEKVIGHVKIAEELNSKAVDIIFEEHQSIEGRELIEQTQILQEKIYGLLAELINIQNKNTGKFVEQSHAEYQTTVSLSILFGSIIFLIAWIITRFMAKIITQKNQELVEKNEQLQDVSDQALEATRTKSEFLAIMSHEIRTPLTSIIGFAEALSEGTILRDERLKLTSTIIKNGKHLLSIINDILDISKVEANKMEFEKTYFSPAELVSEVEEIIKGQFIEKGIQFYIEYDFPIPSKICNDPLRTKQIILNLCSNALKFTKAGKVVVKLHADTENELMYFTVIDSGIGLTIEQINKVFDAFTQADSSTTRKFGGTGLGLSLSKRFAEKMGGTITVESLLDIGSQFCLSISTGKIDQQQLIIGEPELPQKIDYQKLQHDYSRLVKGSILIVEDNPDNQQLLSILLSGVGADIDYAENGQKALTKGLNKHYDLIFMDIQMPVMGGLEATKLLRKNNYKKPIVALTANAMKSDYDMCIAAGCDGFLTKPIDKDEIFQTIYKYLNVETETKNFEKISAGVYANRSEKIQELILKFIKGLPGKVEKIENCKNEKKWQEMREVLHKLKGVGTSMGYPAITEVTASLEYEVKQENEQKIESLLTDLKMICDRIVKSVPDLFSESKE